MEYIIAIFKKIIKILIDLFSEKPNKEPDSEEMNFVLFDGENLLTLDGKTFLVKEVN